MKTITVPLNLEAQELLDLDKCPSDQLDEITLPQEQFDELWSIGFFKYLNEICGSMIDDYEDESIAKYESLKAVLEYIKSEQWPDDILGTVNEIERLFIVAMEKKTSVHFYL